MHPKIHFIAGLILVTIFYFIFPKISLLNLSIIFFSSVLIDADHYLYYIFKKRNFNLFKAYDWFKYNVNKTCKLPFETRKRIYTGFYLLHGIEPMIIIFLIGLNISQLFFFVFIGFSFHLFLDIPSEIIVKGTFQKISLIYNYSQFKKLES